MSSTWSQSASYTKIEQTSAPATRDLVALVESVSPFGETADANVLEVGCGTGMLTKAIKDKAREVKLTATDMSEKMVEAVEKLAKQESWPHTTTTPLDAFSLSPPLPESTFSHALSAFCICLLPNDPASAIAQMHSVLRPSGLLALANWGAPNYLWDRYPVFLRAVRRVLNDSSYEMPVMMNATWCSADATKKELEKMGWRNVSVEQREYPSRWKDAEEVEDWLLAGGNPIVWEELLKPFEERFGKSRYCLKGALREEVEKMLGMGEVTMMVPVNLVLARK